MHSGLNPLLHRYSFLRLVLQTTFENNVTKEEIAPALSAEWTFKIYLNVVYCKIAVWGKGLMSWQRKISHNVKRKCNLDLWDNNPGFVCIKSCWCDNYLAKYYQNGSVVNFYLAIFINYLPLYFAQKFGEKEQNEPWIWGRVTRSPVPVVSHVHTVNPVTLKIYVHTVPSFHNLELLFRKKVCFVVIIKNTAIQTVFSAPLDTFRCLLVTRSQYTVPHKRQLSIPKIRNS